MSNFRLLDLVPIHKAGLAARCRLQMPSGLILTCNITRARKDPSSLSVSPVAERNFQGGYTPLVEFATEELRKGWQALAMKVLQPRLHELTQPPKAEEASADAYSF